MKKNLGALFIIFMTCSLFAQTNITSVHSGNWNDLSTWSTGTIPTSEDNITINSGHTVKINSNASCKDIGVIGELIFEGVTGRALSSRNLYVHDQGIVQIDLGTVLHTMNISGNITNDGTIDLSSNGGSAITKIEFTGNGQIFSGKGITDISSLTINTATSTATVLIEPENFTVHGMNTNATGFLNLTRGEAWIKGNFPLETFLFTDSSPIIAVSTAVRLDNPNLIVKGQNGNVTVNGRLHVSNGTIFNVGVGVDNSLVLGPNSESSFKNATINVAGAFGVASPSHVLKIHFDGATTTVQTAGNYSESRAGFDLGFNSLTNATSTGSTFIIQNANTGTGGDYRTPLGFNITGSTVQFGNALSTGASTFRIRGVVPDLVIDQTFNHSLQLFGTTTITSPVSIPSGATMDLNGNGLSLRSNLHITAGSTLMGHATSSSLTFGGSEQQTFNNDGTLTDGFIRSIVINNSSSANPAVVINDNVTITNSLFLTFGTLGGTGTLTLGNSAVSSTITMTRVNGSILNQPLFGPGVTYNANYNISLSPTVTGIELPSTIGTLTINNSNGVILNATTTAQKLTLTNGTLNTATSSALTIAGTDPADISFSPTSYVNGPIIITLPPLLDGSSTYNIPVGTAKQRVVTLLNTKTDATPNTRIFFHAYDYFGDITPGSGISALTETQRWFVSVLTGEGSVTETRVRFSGEGFGDGNRIAKSTVIDGTYNSIGGTVSGNSITSDIINSFSYFAIGITNNTFAGTYTVGSSSADYSTLTAAINAVKAGGLSAPVVLSLLDATYPTEIFPIVISQIAGASMTNTLTIKPAPSNVVTISGGSSSGIFKLDGADYVTIDGSNNGTNSRDLSIINTDFYSPIIWLSSQGIGLGSRNNTIKNLNLSGSLSQATSNSGAYGILSSGTSPVFSSDGADNDNNTIHNNFVKKVRWGIHVRGMAGNANDNNSITSNLIGPAEFGNDQIGKGGITVQHQSGVTIRNNEVRSIGSIYPQINDAASDDRVGIGLGSDNWPPITTTITNAIVTGNVVHDIIDERTRSAVGILIAGGGSPSNNVVANNMIYNVRSNGTSGEQGIGIGVYTGSEDKIVFNSIRLEGDIDPAGSTTASGSNVGIRIFGGTNPTVKNNIISVDLTSNTDTLKHYAIVTPSFYSWGTGGLNYNDYYVNATNTQMRIGGIGFSFPYASYADISTWKTNFSGTQDAGSTSFAPDFISSTNLHLNLSSVNTNYIAMPIAEVLTDIDGDTRSTIAPYKGGDENTIFLLPDLIAPLAPQDVAVADSGNASIKLRWRKNTEPDFVRYRIYGGTSSNSTIKIDSTNGGIGDTTRTFSALMNDVRYYFRVTAVDNAGNESGYSNQVNAMPVANMNPSVPLSLIVTDSSSKTITLTWRKINDPDFLRYRIYRSTIPSPSTKVDSTTAGASDTVKTFTGLINDIRYYFRITAVDSTGNESGFSNEVNTVPADRLAPAVPQQLFVTDSSNTQIEIMWRKNADADFLKYRIYRATSPNAAVKVDSTIDTSKTFIGLTNGVRYYFRISAVDSTGNESAYSNEVNGAPNAVTAVNGISNQIPKEYSLAQNYPNPFNPSTIIRYGLPFQSGVTLEIYTILGQQVALLTNEVQDARFYEVKWQATVSSGLYFYRLRAHSTENPTKHFVQVRKMVLLK